MEMKLCVFRQMTGREEFGILICICRTVRVQTEKRITMRIMAIDLGLARTGLAISDPEERLAFPVCTIEQYYQPERMAVLVADEAKRGGAEQIVIGHPRNMDGSCGESARRAEEFADCLREKTPIPVELWDERLTTVSAIGYLNETGVRGKKRKAVIDAVAATVILENYMNHRRLTGKFTPGK